MDKKEINEYKNELNKYEKELNELKNKLKKIKIIIEEKEKKINNEKIKIIELKKSLLYNNSNINKIKESINIIKRNINNDIKLNIPIEIKSGEKMMSVIFISTDQNIHYSVICKNTDSFLSIEKLFYDKYPEYKNTKNDFFVNGKKVYRTLNLDKNKINNSDIIIFKPFKY